VGWGATQVRFAACLHKGLEQPFHARIILQQLLGVPLDRHYPPVTITFQSLREPVGCAGGHAQTGAHVSDPLVVEAVDLEFRVAQYPCQATVRL
jgi:hypothetical protein